MSGKASLSVWVSYTIDEPDCEPASGVSLLAVVPRVGETVVVSARLAFRVDAELLTLIVREVIHMLDENSVHLILGRP